MSDIQYDYSKWNALWFVVFLLIYETSTYIANDMIMPGMINVVRSFSAPDSMVSTSLTAFILGGGSLQIILGPLSDRYGRRPVMLGGAVFFLLSTIFISVSQSMNQFILARFFQGMGLCFISVVGYATLQEIFTEMYAIRLIALMNNITILAPLTGPLLGSLIIHLFSWRAVFYIIAIFTFISLIGIWVFMPETIGIKKLDGTFINSTPLRYRIIKENYLSLIKNHRFIMGSFAIGFASIPIIAWIGVSPLILIKSAHLSIIQYGLWQLPVFISAILGNFTMRLQTYRRSLQQITTIGSFILLFSLSMMALLVLFVSHHYTCIIIGISCYAFGLGFTSAPLNRLTLFSTIIPKGTASALISVILMLLTAMGNQMAGYIYTNQSNVNFSLFCAGIGIIYFLIFAMMHKLTFIRSYQMAEQIQGEKIHSST